MTVRIPGLSIAADPLIAEAKRRTRQRRAGAAAAVLAVVALGAGLTSALRSPAGGSTSIPSDLPRLPSSVALGTLIAVDRRTGVAEFRISCGWHTTKRGGRTGKVRPRLFRVPLHGFRFTVETRPGSGAWRYVSLSTWERRTKRSVGTGAFYLSTGLVNGAPPLITDSDTTVCDGVLGYPGPT